MKQYYLLTPVQHPSFLPNHLTSFYFIWFPGPYTPVNTRPFYQITWLLFPLSGFLVHIHVNWQHCNFTFKVVKFIWASIYFPIYIQNSAVKPSGSELSYIIPEFWNLIMFQQFVQVKYLLPYFWHIVFDKNVLHRFEYFPVNQVLC